MESNQMNRTLKLLPIITLLMLAFSAFPQANATEYYIFGNTSGSNSGTGSYPTQEDIVNGGNVTVSGILSQYYVVYAAFKVYSPSFPIFIKGLILNSTGHIVAVSTVEQVSASGTVYCTFTSTVTLTNNTEYIAAYISSNDTGYAYNAAGGTFCQDNSNVYATPVDATDIECSSSLSPVAYLYCQSDDPTATPTPSVGPYDSSDTETVINDVANYLVPLILFLLPAFILGWLTHWEKWPILIGLAIGSGLTYLFLGTQYLWLVILVVIGIGAAAYQSTRGWSN